jgi:hypothetical protein
MSVATVIAAKILALSEKTVRAWAAAGLLTAGQRSPRLLAEIRADGLERDLLEHVWHRLEDRALLDRADLRESIEELRAGDVTASPPIDGTLSWRESVTVRSRSWV